MKFLFTYLILLLSIGSFAQKPLVVLEVDLQNAKPGELITLTIKTNVEGEFDIDLPASYVQGYNMMNGMEQQIDYQSGKIQTIYYLTNTGAFKTEGKFKIGPAYVKRGNKVYRSNTVYVDVKNENTDIVLQSDEISKNQLKKAAFGIVELSKKTIYEGEGIVVSSRVYAHDEPKNIENYQSYTISGVLEKHEINKSQQVIVDQVKVKGLNLYTFTYDKNLIYPSGSGKIEINPFKLLISNGFQSIPITSSATIINVKPLPTPPKNFYGAVGEFSISQSIKQTKINQGDVFHLELVVTGTGNLQNIQNPILQLPKGFYVYGDPKITEDYHFSAAGAEGSITYLYNIQSTTYGNLQIPAIDYAYFNPKIGKYMTLKGESHALYVIKNINFKPIHEIDKNESVIASNDDVLIYKEEKIASHLNIIHQQAFWLTLASPLLVVLGLGVIKKRKEKTSTQKVKTSAIRHCVNSTNNYLENARISFDEGNCKCFYSSIEKAILETLILKLNLPNDEIHGKIKLLSLLSNMYDDKSLFNEIKSILTECELGCYGLGELNNDKLYERAKSSIHQLLNS